MRDQLDAQMREMTYKLMQMAPPAPPYSEVPLTKLQPEKAQTNSILGSRRPVAVWVAAGAFGLALLLALPIFLFNRDGSPVDPSNSTSTTPSTTVPVATVDIDMTLYFFADYVESSNVVGPHLVPVRRRVPVITAGQPDLSDQILAAIDALIAGPSVEDAALIPGIAGTIPVETQILSLIVDETSGPSPVVTVDFSDPFDNTNDQADALRRIAQVVYTATQFGNPDIEILVEGADPDFDSAGLLTAGPQGREAHRDVLPLIFAEQPLPGDVVTSPVEIAGVANTFEATLQWRIELADGDRLSEGFATADCGAGCFGSFSFTAEYALSEPTAGFVVLFEASAEDGSAQNVVRIPVMLEPASRTGSLEVGAQLPGGQALEDRPVVVESPLLIFGTTDATDLTVNGIETPVAADGSFEARVDLEPGTNIILVGAGDGNAGFIIGQPFEVTYVPDGEVRLGFIKSVNYSDSGEVTSDNGEPVPYPLLLTIDFAEWLTGEAADRAAIEDGAIAEGETVPNGYYIRNPVEQAAEVPGSESTRTFVVDPATIRPIRIELAEWVTLFAPSNSESYLGAGLETTPHWFVIDGDGEVLQIVQQYIP